MRGRTHSLTRILTSNVAAIGVGLVEGQALPGPPTTAKIRRRRGGHERRNDRHLTNSSKSKAPAKKPLFFRIRTSPTPRPRPPRDRTDYDDSAANQSVHVGLGQHSRLPRPRRQMKVWGFEHINPATVNALPRLSRSPYVFRPCRISSMRSSKSFCLRLSESLGFSRRSYPSRQGR